MTGHEGSQPEAVDPHEAARPGAARPDRALTELAAATSTLTADHDVVGTTTLLLAGCARAVGAAAAGVLLARPDDRELELLAATSHRAEELDLYQLQVEQGPCLDAVRTVETVTATGVREIEHRWPLLVDTFRAVGVGGVRAVPLLWHGDALGAMNLFFADSAAVEGSGSVAQAFADIATIAIVHSGRVMPHAVIAQARAALDERVVVEQAKGVLAQTDQLELDKAFDRLLTLAAERGRPLGTVAAEVVEAAGEGRPPTS
ncbi:ANTAR domain protein with unknown sensor [Kribbella flavida DSM 17836]|uniref:ANTAR domain-containing protein n=1 Tax=Kribbella flavida (strain DSM 17836 / JCM 10339 / NBRC 14399) TaxID=479435 RepID=D2Q2U0_KRIFD|nr:ANTAR domain-containing protein [Kribbella flavida]ADB30271.1 ANTAR domain protein with unknown sensor [Kribbella flavida DSM 17836]